MTYLIHNDQDKVISAASGEYKLVVRRAKELNASYITEVGGEHDGEVVWQKRS